ncbi:glycine--tRNA ligase [Mycoplasmopsis hyopharyngis]|uniref:glycine--tRNA ligase n=1 Tax=Mycoplasmopsis hyopharyngis TaxID=29558 RepID=UPI0038736EBB
MQEIVNHLKNTGFVFQGSEIYGGLANTWDYGPLGSLLKDNLASQWKKYFIFSKTNSFLIDSKILMNPRVWITSGHVSNFNDPLIENKVNGKRYRADKLICEHNPNIIPETMTFEQMEEYIRKNIPTYENEKTSWSAIRKFNLMFETKQGVIEDNKNLIYLRPETAQGIFVNFKNVQRITRSKLPMIVGQIGKSFRNEVTPGNFIFRTREFEQMEIEVFCHPKEASKIYKEYIKSVKDFVLFLGINKTNIRVREHQKEELSHYSKGTTDIEYMFPFGWGELLGVANRGDFDLTSHKNATNENLDYLDPITNEKFIPWIIEPSIGLDRLMLAVLIDSYDVEKIDDSDERIVLRLDKKLSPYKIAVLPLVKKLNDKADSIFKDLLAKDIIATYDESGSIGKRYRRQDAIGTPYCVTVDYDTLNDNMVTIRDRDTMKQERIHIEKIIEYLK